MTRRVRAVESSAKWVIEVANDEDGGNARIWGSFNTHAEAQSVADDVNAALADGIGARVLRVESPDPAFDAAAWIVEATRW